jgi:hypothetical protein
MYKTNRFRALSIYFPNPILRFFMKKGNQLYEISVQITKFAEPFIDFRKDSPNLAHKYLKLILQFHSGNAENTGRRQNRSQTQPDLQPMKLAKKITNYKTDYHPKP